MDSPEWSVWPAPAKLNLFLHITGRRADGYHDLQTLFQILDWGDRIHLCPRIDGEIRLHGTLPDVPEDEDLVVRAARLLQERYAPDAGVDIRVDKQIPMGGGLGGGSSDAATTLVALNWLWGCGLESSELARIGLSLGADVPVFVHGHTAFAEGVGEHLTPVALGHTEYLLVDPGVSISTRELFMAPELTRDLPRITIAGLISGARTQNVFEPVVCSRYPAVARALDWLRQFGSPRLSGTGGVVFVPIGASAGSAAVAECPHGMRAWLARGVDRSPLLAMLDERVA